MTRLSRELIRELVRISQKFLRYSFKKGKIKIPRHMLCFERYTVEFCLKYGAGYGTRTRRLLLGKQQTITV
nr:MAG TPA: hypothetical protein [Bacteriophage sp.]